MRRDISPVQRGISRYAEGQTPHPIDAGVCGVAAALGLTAPHLHSWLFGIASVAKMAVAATPKPRESHTVSGAIHTVAGFVNVLSVAAAALARSMRQPRSAVADLLGLATGVFLAAVLGVPGLRDATVSISGPVSHGSSRGSCCPHSWATIHSL